VIFNLDLNSAGFWVGIWGAICLIGFFGGFRRR
jgi:hypothetical protein